MVPPAVTNAGPALPEPNASTTASMIHATPSSTAPLARASDPCRVPAMLRSVMIRASIGNAVMARATPTNAAVTPIDTPSTRIGTTPAVARTSSTPRIRGAVTPASETTPAVPARLVTLCDLKAYPVWNMNRTRPICPTT